MNEKMTKVLAAIACACMMALALVGCGGATTVVASDAQGITVSASSEVKVVPDKARLSVAVVSEEKTAEACQSANVDAVNSVIEALGGLGVEDESIQTSNSDLSPRYGSRTSGKDGDDADVEDWVITGYEMRTTLTVSDLEIDNVGAVVQACVAAGANETEGIEYYASNYDEVYNDALARALEVARGKADGIAGATGAGVGKVLNVVEGYQDTSTRYVNSYDALAEAADVSTAGAAKTMPGQIEISANVTVTYAIS